MPQKVSYHGPESQELGLPVSLMGVQNSMQFTEQDVDEGNEIDLSHELRTTLAIITLLSGNLDLLYERLDDTQRRKMIRDLRTQTQKLNTFISDVLALCNSNGVVAM